MKSIDTLVADMHQVIKGEGGWSGLVGASLGNNISLTANQTTKTIKRSLSTDR